MGVTPERARDVVEFTHEMSPERVALNYDMYMRCKEELAMRIVRWGKSLAVRLPHDLVETLKLRPGDEIEITVSDARKFEVTRDRTIENALASIRKFRGRMPAGFKFDRSESNSRG